MIEAVGDRLRSAQRMIGRLTLVPALVRFGVFLSVLVSFAFALPSGALAGRPLGLLVIVAALPAAAPRRIWPTFTTLIAVGGWLVATTGFDEPVTLWRLLGLATSLYLSHNLCALAALLPYDAVVDPAMITRWLGRSLAVVVAAAVLGVGLLAVIGRGGGGTLLGAAIGGLAVAVAVAALLAWLLRRR